MERELLGIATSAESESVRLAAIRDAFDRGGLGAKAEIELSAKPKEPWQEVFDGIAALPRHDSAVVGPPQNRHPTWPAQRSWKRRSSRTRSARPSSPLRRPWTRL